VPEIPTWLSLVLILAVFVTTTVTSLRTTRVAAPDHESARG
jgi:hypothetical protein